MKKIRVIITDTHFGVKNNSVTWLNSQLKFLRNQLKPKLAELKKDYNVTLIHLGDLFDCRSSINTMVLYNVNNILKELSEVCDSIIILGGNHDYYSPLENDIYNINSLDVLDNIPNVKIVSSEPSIIDGILYVPWFHFHNISKLKNALSLGTFDLIATHTDLLHQSEEHYSLLKDYKIISGHIHSPNKINRNKFNLGSCYPLTFIDANQDRGYYIMIENDIDSIELYKNTQSIQFYRIVSDDIINIDVNKINNNDYVELYLNDLEYSDSKYTERIKLFNSTCNCNTIISSKPIQFNSINIEENFDIIDICRCHIPEHLLEKFNKTVDLLNKTI